MRTVDTKGQLCPAPLIAAKKALKETTEGESFMLLTDNLTSFENLSRFLKDNKAGFQVSEAEGTWTFTITKTQKDLVKTKPEEYCGPSISHFQKGNFVVVISSEKMGEGDDQLGHLLVRTFIKALKDLDELPKKIIFYNSGVKLMAKSSEAIQDLMDLEKMGVELILCGTCVNFYNLGSVIEAGIISNMFSIAEVLASSYKIIKP